MNAAWHAKHRMPPKATLEQRLAWHAAHAEHCACRSMPPELAAQVRAWRARGGRQQRSRVASPRRLSRPR